MNEFFSNLQQTKVVMLGEMQVFGDTVAFAIVITTMAVGMYLSFRRKVLSRTRPALRFVLLLVALGVCLGYQTGADISSKLGVAGIFGLIGLVMGILFCPCFVDDVPCDLTWYLAIREKHDAIAK